MVRQSEEVAREELAWAAGFFDGEGWIGFKKCRTGNPSLHLVIGQIDRRVLDRFQKAVLGLGKVNGPYDRQKVNWNVQYFFEIASFESVQAIVAMLFQFLSPVKKEQCLKALKEYSEWFTTAPHQGWKLSCRRGHSDWYVEPNSRRRQCKECRRIMERARRNAKRR